jgi:histidine triad (HIT) family protein
MNEENCIFCRIVDGTIPCKDVYEDDDYLAFLDIRPITSGHTIIVPKKHIADLENMSYKEISGMSIVMKKIGKALISGLGVKGYSVFLDNKSAANQHIPHIHYHVVPRASGDGLDRWPQQDRYSEGVDDYCQNKIAEALQD